MRSVEKWFVAAILLFALGGCERLSGELAPSKLPAPPPEPIPALVK